MGVRGCMMLRVRGVWGRSSAGEMSKELVWIKVLCGGGGCRGRAGALAKLGLGEHHLLVGPCWIEELSLWVDWVGLLVLILVKGRVKGLCWLVLVLLYWIGILLNLLWVLVVVGWRGTLAGS